MWEAAFGHSFGTAKSSKGKDGKVHVFGGWKSISNGQILGEKHRVCFGGIMKNLFFLERVIYVRKQ